MLTELAEAWAAFDAETAETESEEDNEEALLLPEAAKADATDEALDATEEALDDAYAAALEADLLATLAADEAEGEPCLDA